MKIRTQSSRTLLVNQETFRQTSGPGTVSTVYFKKSLLVSVAGLSRCWFILLWRPSPPAPYHTKTGKKGHAPESHQSTQLVIKDPYNTMWEEFCSYVLAIQRVLNLDQVCSQWQTLIDKATAGTLFHHTSLLLVLLQCHSVYKYHQGNKNFHVIWHFHQTRCELFCLMPRHRSVQQLSNRTKLH